MKLTLSINNNHNIGLPVYSIGRYFKWFQSVVVVEIDAFVYPIINRIYTQDLIAFSWAAKELIQVLYIPL